MKVGCCPWNFAHLTIRTLCNSAHLKVAAVAVMLHPKFLPAGIELEGSKPIQIL